MAFLALGLDVGGSPTAVVALAIGNAVLGMSLGLFLSAFAGSRVPGRAVHARVHAPPAAALRPVRASRADGWRRSSLISDALPLTYAFDALDRVAAGGEFGGRGWLDVTVILGVTLLALALGALTLRRRTA